MKKISVITICYNSINFIQNTVESIIGQDYGDQMEYIVIDGGSTDGTVELLQQYGDRIDVLVSEKDNGIYDAMNKGLSHANGEWVCFMNSSDMFHDKKTLSEVFNGKEYHNSVKVLYGRSSSILANGEMKENPLNPIDVISIRMPFSHQCSFTRIEIAKKLMFDETYKIVADYNFFYTIYHTYGKSAFLYIPCFIADCDATDSFSRNNVFHLWRENLKIRSKHKDLRWIVDRYIKLPIKLLLNYDKRIH